MVTTAKPRSLPSATDPVLAELIDGVSRRLEAGQPVDLDAFIAAHPERADALRLVLPALAVLADLGRSAVRQPAAPTVPDEALGKLGDYRILREVGRGGMGVVYEALQVSLNRRVAVKVLPFAGALDSQHLARFRLEAQAAAQLHHSNIVPVFAVGCERGVHYYAMQFIEGRTLAALIAELRAGSDPDAANTKTIPQRGQEVQEGAGKIHPEEGRSVVPLSARNRADFRVVAELGRQAAEALEHAHRYGILHRDVKPANLILDDRGNLWVTDFGLARVGDDASLTMTGDLLGTLRYMSPEQALGQPAEVGPRSDVYSLGATLYELLTLRPAVSGRDRQQVLRRIADEEPRPPRQLTPTIPRELETIVLKAMAREPGSRYASAQAMADDLRRFLEHKPIQARRPTLLDRAWKWQRRHSWAFPTVVAVLALILAGLTVSTFLIAREQHATRLALQTARSHAARAVARREHAESILREACDELNRLLLTTDPDDPARTSGMTPRQEALAAEAVRFHEAVLRRLDPDPEAGLERGFVYQYLANVFFQRRDLARAVAIYHQAIDAYRSRVDQDPGDAYAWDQLAQGHSILGLTLHDAGRPEEAVEPFRDAAAAYEQAVQFAPASPQALMYLAWFLASCPDRRFQDPGRAITLCHRALEFDPDSRAVWNALGVASYRTGNLRDCISALTRSMQLGDGGDGIDWCFLSMAYSRLGESTVAQQWYDRAAHWTDRHNALDGEIRRYQAEAAALLTPKGDGL